MLPESKIFNFKTLNFVNNRSVRVNFENIIFIGVGLPDFREGQVEKRDKTGISSISQGFQAGFLLFVLQW